MRSAPPPAALARILPQRLAVQRPHRVVCLDHLRQRLGHPPRLMVRISGRLLREDCLAILLLHRLDSVHLVALVALHLHLSELHPRVGACLEATLRRVHRLDRLRLDFSALLRHLRHLLVNQIRRRGLGLLHRQLLELQVGLHLRLALLHRLGDCLELQLHLLLVLLPLHLS